MGIRRLDCKAVTSVFPSEDVLDTPSLILNYPFQRGFRSYFRVRDWRLLSIRQADSAAVFSSNRREGDVVDKTTKERGKRVSTDAVYT